MVVIATVLPCDGQNYCIEETLEASRSSLPVIDSPSESIQVTPQLNATYYPSQIGAYCSLAYMQWVENGIHYSIGVKCGKREDLIALTKSAIQQR